MQEVRDEIAGRITTLKNRAKFCEEQIAEHRAEIEKISAELAAQRMLEAQYRSVLDGLPKP